MIDAKPETLPSAQETEAPLRPVELPPVRVAKIGEREGALGSVATVEIEDTDKGASAMLNRALGTEQSNFANGLLMQIIRLAVNGSQVVQSEFDFALSAAAGIQPRDEAESTLATQMAAVHLATMRAAAQLATATNPKRIDLAERMFNKLARTLPSSLKR